MRTSPFFTIYGVILLILQYLSGFKLSFDQFNFGYDRLIMKQIGIEINDYQPAFIPLIVKVCYLKNKKVNIGFCLVIIHDVFLVNISTIYQ